MELRNIRPCLILALALNVVTFNIPRERFLLNNRVTNILNPESQSSLLNERGTRRYYDIPVHKANNGELKASFPFYYPKSHANTRKLKETSQNYLIETFPRRIIVTRETFPPTSSIHVVPRVRTSKVDPYWWNQKGKHTKRFADFSKHFRLLGSKYSYPDVTQDLPNKDDDKIFQTDPRSGTNMASYEFGKDMLDNSAFISYEDPGDGYSELTIHQLSVPPDKLTTLPVQGQADTDKPPSEMIPSAQRRLALEGEAKEKEFAGPFAANWDTKNLRFTTFTVGSLMIFLIFIVMVLALRVHCRNREKSAQEWIRHPMVQPTTAASGIVQPDLKHILNSNQLSSEPVRIKAKGLLERRGSNTSLTIDLGSSSEGGADISFASSKECTPEDFLMTAGSRMSRRQLRMCLRDPRDLHAEFWQIPTNHPDRCSVPGAAAKNRYRTVLPNEDTRVVLRNAPPDSPETPASQYINANYIRGYDGEEKSYIATQGPLAHTIEDLWLMVMQERCPAVVMITRLKEKGRVKCEPYVPNYSATYGGLQVTVKQVIQKSAYTIRQIFLKKGDDVHTTLHFWFTSWPDHKAPSSARHLLAMAAEVESAKKDSPRGPVAVHCSAGIGRTGCFIAISIGIHQLLEEDCADVLSIVCQMRLDRGGMVQTAEQYEFIHRALAFYEATLPCTSAD